MNSDSIREALYEAASKVDLPIIGFDGDWERRKGINYYNVSLLASSLQEVTRVLEQAYQARELVKALKEWREEMWSDANVRGSSMSTARITKSINDILDTCTAGETNEFFLRELAKAAEKAKDGNTDIYGAFVSSIASQGARMDETQELTEEQINRAGDYLALPAVPDTEAEQRDQRRWPERMLARYALHVNAELIEELEDRLSVSPFLEDPRLRDIINKYKGDEDAGE